MFIKLLLIGLLAVGIGCAYSPDLKENVIGVYSSSCLLLGENLYAVGTSLMVHSAKVSSGL